MPAPPYAAIAASCAVLRIASSSPPRATTPARRAARSPASSSFSTARFGGRVSRPSAVHSRKVGAGRSS
ncbi:MAG TPA: hypothetical protein VFU46_11575, partial [Gemmatimonadales bacterium]|nr:hypothetical protein [Gemmatimonadales bacterium]